MSAEPATAGSRPGTCFYIDDECLGCGLCRDQCPERAIAMTADGRFVCGPSCQGCASCLELCPVGAVKMRPGPAGAGG